MTNKRGFKSAFSALLALLLPGAQAAQALQGALDLGGRMRSLTGAEDKFNEYRDVRDGFFIDALEFSLGGDAYRFDVEAKNGGRRDESYKVEGGKYGKFKASAAFDSTPHRFATGRMALSGEGTNSLGIASAIQAQIQASEETRAVRGAVPITDPTGKDAAQQSLIRDVIANSGPTSFGLERRKGSMAFEYDLTPGVKTWVKASEERRSGFRQMGTGSYERYAQGATDPAAAAAPTHTSDMFIVLGQQVAEPVNYRTTALNVGAGFYDKAYSADLEYAFTDFIDGLQSLTWANPFRSADASSTNNADALGTDAAGFSGYGRYRSSRDRLALPPSNRSHDVAASGSIELPMNGRLTAALGYGAVTQDADLLPYTANTAINAAIGAPANATAVAALPVQRFNGKVQTITQSLLLSLKPTEGLAVRAKFRGYDYDNRSPQVTFPGYAAYSESHWRTRRNDFQALGTGAVTQVVSYNRRTAELGADYDLTEALSAGVETSWDRWSYKNNRVDATTELGVGGGLDYRLGSALKAHGKYRYSRRAAKGYKVGENGTNPEAIGLENFNWADRKRHRVDAGVSVEPAAGFTLGLDGQFQQDRLGAQRFGLKKQDLLAAAVEVGYAPDENFELSLSLGKEERRSKMQNGAKDDKFNDTTTSADDTFASSFFSPLNYWNSDIVDRTDTVALETSYRPRERWQFNAGYSFTNARTSVITSNPNTAEAIAAGDASGTQLGNALAQDWPGVSSKLHELRVGGAYKLTKDVSFGLDYAFARYMLSDFANVGGYVAGTNPGENTTRFVLNGADQYDYTAHMLGARVAMRF